MPTMALHQFSAEIEAQTRAGNPLVKCIVRTHKATEDLPLLLLRDTNACIFDAYQHRILLVRIHIDLDGPAQGTILDRIANNIRQHLLNTLLVDIDDKVVSKYMQRQRMAFGGDLQTCNDALQQRDQVHRLKM